MNSAATLPGHCPLTRESQGALWQRCMYTRFMAARGRGLSAMARVVDISVCRGWGRTRREATVAAAPSIKPHHP